MSESATNNEKAELAEISERRETIDALRPAIEEMKSGQGEPVEIVLAPLEALIRQPKEL